MQFAGCSAKTVSPALHQVVHERRSANYNPTIWSYESVQSLCNSNADVVYKEKAKKLEEKVRCMISHESESILELIDDIQRLGLGYVFEDDIKRALDRFVALGEPSQNSLHATSLGFRLLRQHGYQVSQDIFKDFMDDEGDVKACLKNDVKGVLSLYEASFFNFEQENILENAKTKTATHLKHIQKELCEPELQESVAHALELPLFRRMVMLEARWHIEAYSKRKDASFTLLEFAQLNFNMVQSILQQDLKDMSRWWNNLGLSNKLSFSRDRLVECFFWTVGMAFEPQFSSYRKGLTKVAAFITTIDDVYDVYGTLDELELFTSAVERWDVNAAKDLPKSMQLSFMALYNTVNEMAYEALKEHGDHILPYLSKAWADVCKAFLQEAKWSHKKLIPTYEEYIENGWRSVSGTVILIHTYFLLHQTDSSWQTLSSLLNYHEILKFPSIIFRLTNDLATSSDELNRGEVVSAITCYMNENGVSEEDARKHINEMINKAWTKLNKYQGGEGNFGNAFKESAFNIGRISQCIYQHGDSHGAPDSTSKQRVLSIIFEPVSLLKI